LSDQAQDLAGRRVVISGAARGLGRALAIVAADRGADIVLLARDPPALQRTTEAVVKRSGRVALAVPCDLADPASIREACAMVQGTGAAVDVLINNGAPWLPGTLEENSDDEIAHTIGAAVTGTVLLSKGLLPALKQSKAADIVTVVSTSGLLGDANRWPSPAFQAAKHGQSGFSDRLRHDLKAHGIRVTAIYPPDFADADPLAPEWDRPRDPAAGENLSAREVVAAVMFAITAPRACAYPMIVLDNMRRG
jgi:NAD(P)-dependent dehydrogenase (short-subunit alcohol dehydrogenase family)